MWDNLKELYRYRALLFALVGRHLSSRYRGSFLGFFWSLLNPLCLMLVYTVAFRYYMRAATMENYTIFVFCGLLPWLWITSAVSEGTTSIVSSGHLITKSMFPAHLLPVVAVVTNLVNLLLSLPLLLLFMVVGGVPFHPALAALPLIILLQFIFLQGIGLTLGALNVHFRDIQHIVGNVLTFLFFLTPIVYPWTVVPERFRFTLELNPLAVFTITYQQIILEGVWPSLHALGFLAAVSLFFFVLGHTVFNRYRESFAELL